MSTKFKLFRNNKLISLLTKKNDKTIKPGDLIYGIDFVDKENGEYYSPDASGKPYINFYKRVVNTNGDEVDRDSSSPNINNTTQGTLTDQYTEEALITRLTNPNSQTKLTSTISDSMMARRAYFYNTSDSQQVQNAWEMFNNIIRNSRGLTPSDVAYEKLNAFGYLKAYKNTHSL